MKTRGVLSVILALTIVLLIVGFASSQSSNTTSNITSSSSSSSTSSATSGSVTSSSSLNDESDNIQKAYTCLTNEVKNNTRLSLDEAFFSVLAIGNSGNALDKIDDNKDSKDCWPKGSCTLKDTAIAALAYQRLGRDNSEIIDWLLSKNSTSNNLVWYLQIDTLNHNATACTMRYDNNKYSFSIDEDQKIQGGAGSCLTVSSNGYWYQVSENCLRKEFEVSCDEDFVTSVVYQKKNGDTVFVSADTHSASSSGYTREKISADCFKQGSTCDYEGSLWASLALSRNKEDVTAFTPYLVAMSDDNVKYFPSAFLSVLTGIQEFHSDVVESQKQDKFWEINAGQKFYDTSLAMIALGGTGDQALSNAQTYLLSIQTDKGCWNNNNIRDTAFLLYSGWPKSVPGDGSGSGSSALCTSASASYSCGLTNDCRDAGGSILYNFECTGINQYCCSKQIVPLTCKEKGGILCAASQVCTGVSSQSVDGACCMGVGAACQNKPVETENECESIDLGVCKSSCSSDEEETGSMCSTSSQICCVSNSNNSSSGISIWVWILLLLILIVLTVIGILYKDKLNIWWHSMRSKKNKPEDRDEPRGMFPPQGMRPPRFGPPAMGRPRMPTQPMRPSGRDKEMEETFKKLREMSG